MFFVALHIVVSTTTNGHDCTGPCETSTWGGTTCYINEQSKSFGWITCPSNAAGGGGLLSCYDWCGYTYVLQCDGSCTAKAGASCGSSSGTCKPKHVCADANNHIDSHCVGSPPSSGSTTYCPATACSSTPPTPSTAVSVKSKNGFNCLSSGCSSTIDMTGTWCYVPVASSSNSGLSWTCSSGSMNGVTGCFDYCGYKYTKTGSSGPCTSKPGADCGPSSGQKQNVYKCVDNELYNGNKCTGSVPVSYVDCEMTACPPSVSSTSSGKHCSSSALFFCLQFMASTPDARPSDKFAVCQARCTKFSLTFFAD